MTRKEAKSKAAMERAGKVLVGGVNSPVRAYSAVGGTPPVISRGEGAWITDVDGNRYVDYVGSYGPLILGHAHPAVVEAIQRTAEAGTSYGAPTEQETDLAELVVEAVDSVEKVRLVSSGTEAVMSAIRLARGVTGRDKIVKFTGCYHGHSDALLVSAGSGALTLGVPSSPGVPGPTTQDTLVLEYNDLASVESTFAQLGDEIAAVVLEPVAGNMGTIPPVDGFLEGLRGLCDRAGALLIFDEVMTGFRVAWSGAQSVYGVRPDLTTLGKVIGGGMPVGAVGGPAKLMGQMAPEGPIYQAGTLSGNPLAMVAGVATLQQLQQSGTYEQLEETSRSLARGLVEQATAAGLADRVAIQRVGSMLSCFFRPGPVHSHADATAGSSEAFGAFFHAMLEAGVYLPPSPFETFFISTAHGTDEVAQTIEAAGKAFAAAHRAMESEPADR